MYCLLCVDLLGTISYDVQDPMCEQPLDLEGLKLAYKYLTCSTLTIRLAGITQINVSQVTSHTRLFSCATCSNIFPQIKPFFIQYLSSFSLLLMIKMQADNCKPILDHLAACMLAFTVYEILVFNNSVIGLHTFRKSVSCFSLLQTQIQVYNDYCNNENLTQTALR